MCEWNPISQNDLCVSVCVRCFPFVHHMDIMVWRSSNAMGDIKVSFGIVVARRQIEIVPVIKTHIRIDPKIECIIIRSER